MRAAAALYCLFAFAVAAILVALLVFLGQLFVRSTLIKSLDVEIRRSTERPVIPPAVHRWADSTVAVAAKQPCARLTGRDVVVVGNPRQQQPPAVATRRHLWPLPSERVRVDAQPH